MQKTEYAIMLSSTYRDLAEHRKSVLNAMLSQEMFPIAIEYDTAIPDQDLIDASLTRVDEADAYVGLIGYRYGQIPESNERNPNHFSLTELEFRRAIERKIPTCMFIMHDEHPIPRRAVREENDNKQKLEVFVHLAKQNRIYAEFSSIDDLNSKAIQSLIHLRNALESKSPSDGRAFEGRVFSILRAGGFHLRKHIRIADMNLDAIAERNEYGRTKRYAIECRNYARGLSTSDASRIVSAFLPLSDFQSVDEIWIVAPRLSSAARAIFDNSKNFRSFTADELEANRSNLPGGDIRPTSKSKKSRAKTQIGTSIVKNGSEIVFVASALSLLIDEKLASLSAERPNSEEGQGARSEAIQSFERLKRDLSELRTSIVEFSKGRGEEAAVVKEPLNSMLIEWRR